MTFDHFHEPIQHDTTSSCNPWLHSRLLQKLFASLLSYIFPTPQNLSRYSTVLHLPMWCMSKCQGMLKRPRWRGDMHPLSRWRVSVGVRWIGVIMWRREVRCDSRQQVATTFGLGRVTSLVMEVSRVISSGQDHSLTLWQSFQILKKTKPSTHLGSKCSHCSCHGTLCLA